MKLQVAVTAFALTFALTADAQQAASDEFWMPSQVKWVHMAGEPDHEKTARAVVFYFRSDGYFVRDDCWLIKQGKSIAISNGDPHNEYVGLTDPVILDGMRLKYRLVRRNIEVKGEALPGDWISEDASSRTDTGLSIGKKNQSYRRVSLSNAREYHARCEALLVNEIASLFR